MLPPGTIEKINKYYFARSREKEFERAFKEFFGVSSTEDLAGREMPEEYTGLMNEWFIFDYKHANSKTTLENYLLEKGQQLPTEEIGLLNELLRTNRYGMFEVKKIDAGKGLELEDLQSGYAYKVRERKATYSLSIGDVFPARVGKVGGQWELVGALAVFWPIRLQAGARKFFRETKDTLNPQVIFRLLVSVSEDETDTVYAAENVTPAAATARLDELLRLHGLDQHVTVGTIQHWCLEVGENKRSPTEILSLMAGMAGDNISLPALQVLLRAVGDFYNTQRQMILNGKNPQEKRSEPGFGSKGFLTDVTEIGEKEFFDMVSEAQEKMRKSDYPAAVDKFNTAFSILLKHKTTKLDIYRLYANTAIAHFGAGWEREGKILLENSLELNPNYDFAIATKAKYEHGEFDLLVLRGRVEQLRETSKNLGSWDFQAIRQRWEEGKILKQLAEFGINTDKDAFLAVAGKYFSTDDLAKKEWLPHYSGPKDWSEDFVWMAAYALWERWAATLPALEILESAFTDLSDSLFGDFEVDATPGQALDALDQYLRISSPNFISAWKDSSHYVSDMNNYLEAAAELLTTPSRGRILSIAAGYQEVAGDEFWQLAQIMDKTTHKEAGWQGELNHFVSLFPYSPLPFLLLAWMQSDQDDYAKKQGYLLRALGVVERRELEHPETLTYHNNDVMDDYTWVLETLENFYQEHGKKDRLKEIKLKLKKIKQKRQEEASRPGDLAERERLAQEVDRQIRERMQDQPPMIYFSYIKSLGINFKTSELTKSELITHDFGGRVKIGRNESCPCGLGKKYKKCHGRN